MYGTSGSIEDNRTNENDSTIKIKIDEWYQNNLLTNYDKYISKTAIYCNDRSGLSSNENDQRHSGGSLKTYKCGSSVDGIPVDGTQSVADKFSASTEGGGNGQLKYPVALPTANEMYFAGGTCSLIYNKSCWSSKAWFMANGKSQTIIDGYYNFATITPYMWFGYYNVISHYFVSYWGKGGLYTASDGSGASNYIRPVISLDKCVIIKSGDGTPSNPYEIDYENSCN